MTDEKPTFTALRRCCERELALRERVYPKRVADGRMTQEKADLEITLMKGCVEIFTKLEQEEKASGASH